MLFRKAIIGVFTGVVASLSVKAQTFETRSTRYSGQEILDKFNASGNDVQLAIRDSILKIWAGRLGPNDVIETFYNDYHLGLVIYRNTRPHQLLGFWDPHGKQVSGGTLDNGTGHVKTPFNPHLIKNFKSESVRYAGGFKNGDCFYYCDCASVLRKGTFVNNQKDGLWKEFAPNGDFIKQVRLELPKPPVDIVIDTPVRDTLIDAQKDWLRAAHCMMQPDRECPNPGGK